MGTNRGTAVGVGVSGKNVFVWNQTTGILTESACGCCDGRFCSDLANEMTFLVCFDRPNTLHGPNVELWCDKSGEFGRTWK